METSKANTAPSLNIQVNRVIKLLNGQNVFKASDLDKISQTFLVASGTRIYPGSKVPLQIGINKLPLINPDKCKHIRITNKRNVIQSSYSIHGQTLKGTLRAKYL